MNEGGQRQDAALAVVVGAHHEDQILDADDDHQRPEDEREHPEDVVGSHHNAVTVAAEGLAHGIQRAGAHVAVDDAQRPERRRRQRRLAAVVPTAMIL
jgi:hypothetical protein